MLEGVGGGRLGLEAEVARADHDHLQRALVDIGGRLRHGVKSLASLSSVLRTVVFAYRCFDAYSTTNSK